MSIPVRVLVIVPKLPVPTIGWPLASSSIVSQRQIRVSEVRMIQEVEDLEPELQISSSR